MKKKIALFLTLAFSILVFSGCSEFEANTQKIIIASKDFTENEIVTEIYALALEDAGLEVERVFDIRSSEIHTSLINNEIDLYPEYTGTGLIYVLGMDPITDPEKVYKKVKKKYKKKFSVTWLDYSPANDSQGLVIRTDIAKDLKIKNISELQSHAPKLRFASQGEFDKRADGLPALEKAYGQFKWKTKKVVDNSLKYDVLAAERADVCPAYTTEGRLIEKEFTLLKDNLHVWPPYNIAPVVRDVVLDSHPEMADALNKISAEITTDKITELNARVDINGEEFTGVAREFYESITK